MKRSTPLKRKTKLVAKTWLARGASKLGRKRPKDTGPSKDVRDVVKERANWSCERCAQRRGQVPHHRDPRGAGGSSRPEVNEASNLVFICHQCHAHVESYRLAAIGDGFLVPDGYDPREFPIRMWHKGRYGEWLLNDDGGVEPHNTRTET